MGQKRSDLHVGLLKTIIGAHTRNI